MVYEKITKGVTPLSRPKLSKKAQEKDDEIKYIYMKLTGIGIIGNSNYIGTSMSRSIQEVKSKEKPIQFLQRIFLLIKILKRVIGFVIQN